MLSEYGTEQVGISAEVAIADLTGVSVDSRYRLRSRQDLVEHMSPEIGKILHLIPRPLRHIAEEQNPIDFMLTDDKTLSVKTNMRELGKVAPQNIGQPTSTTFWQRMPSLAPAGVDVLGLSYAESAEVFKAVAQTNTSELMTQYWKNLFDCDYLIYVFDVLDRNDQLSNVPSVRLYEKSHSPEWDFEKFSFTREIADWNESCTVKYDGVSIGEFQIHNNRNCFKFRFNLAGLVTARLL